MLKSGSTIYTRETVWITVKSSIFINFRANFYYMERYICENIFVPLRVMPSHKSEMMSQIIFGERFNIIDKSGTWIKIETLFDEYTGWIDTDHQQYTIDNENTQGKVLNRSLQCFKNDKTKIILEAGCEVYNPDFENKSFTIGKNIFKTESEFDKSFILPEKSLTDTALKFLNSPYIWGGRISSGIDCSGLTQLVYKIHGISIPRDSNRQAEIGSIIDFFDDTVAGDLVFFDNERGKISHVGMILSRGLIIHASGRVRIDSIDHQGIYMQEIGKYSHRLRMIKRIV
jgi:gamma-D-glutamyl-L-lysine dipeptidyl-peptidase